MCHRKSKNPNTPDYMGRAQGLLQKEYDVISYYTLKKAELRGKKMPGKKPKTPTSDRYVNIVYPKKSLLTYN